MKRQSTILLLLTTLFILVVSIATITYAWFVEVKRTGAVYFKTGEVVYVMNDDCFKNNLIDDTIIVPGQELVEKDPIYILNESTLSSNLRVKGYVTINGIKYDLNNSSTDAIIEVFDSIWEYDTENQCWYAKENNAEKTFNAVTVSATGKQDTIINLITSIKLNGNVIGNAVESKDVSITLIFQGKQANYADWSDLCELTIYNQN